MKKYLLTMLLWALGLTISSRISAQNVIQNGGFEDGNSGWSLSTTGGTATSAIIQTAVHSGSNAMEITVSQSGTTQKDIELKCSEITVQKDMTYILTFWAKADANFTKATAVFRNVPSASKTFTDTTDVYLTKEWQKFEVVFPSNINGNIIASVQLGKASGVMNFDDFSFEKKFSSWYDGAELRIDKYRKGNFGIQILDNIGNPVKSDSVIINLKKHEFQWGISQDLSDNASGSTYSTTNAIVAPADSEIYQSERYSKDFAYNFPAEPSKKYKLTIKMSENYPNADTIRFFDVLIDGKVRMTRINKFSLAKANYKAFDTTVVVTAASEFINIEFVATGDNASIMGLVLADSASNNVLLRLNCGGSEMTTKSGNKYLSDVPYIDNTIVSSSTTTDDFRKATMLKLFNYGVTGNQFKWSGIEATHNKLTYGPFENTISWFRKVGWDVRGHCLLWGGNSDHELPAWVRALPGPQMHDTCLMRVRREVTRYKGIVKDYDVLNEALPGHKNWLQNNAGDSIDWNCFKEAYKADPTARLVYNDYNIIEWDNDNQNLARYMRKMLAHGAPVSAIGSQSHIGNTVNVPDMKRRLDTIAQFGLPILITEFDMNASTVSQQQHATECAKFMRMCFSYPQVESFITWGLMDPGWTDGVINLYFQDKTPKIIADTFYTLIHEKWSTKLKSTTDTNGFYGYRAFYGDYEVLAKFGTTWKKFTVSNKKADEAKMVVLREDDGVTTSPKLVKLRLNAPSGVELTFDKQMTDPASNYKYFKVFDVTSGNTVKSAALKTGDPNTIVLTMVNPISAKTYIPVSYSPGKVTSIDGGVLEAFGPVLDETLTISYLSADVTKNGKKIAIAFRNKISDASVNTTDFVVKIAGTAVTVKDYLLNTNKDTLYLGLSTPVSSSAQTVTVTYTAGALSTTEGKYVTSFTNTVTNKVVAPKYVSSKVLSYNHKTIQLLFDNKIAASTVQASDFTVKIDDVVTTIVTASIASVTNLAVEIELSKEIIAGNVVTIEYKPGSLTSIDEVVVSAFTGTVTNSFVGVKDLTNEIFVYPNPVNDILTIENASNYSNITITNLTGQIIISSKLLNNFVNINTSALKSGAYVVTLSGNVDKKEYIILKK